MQREFPSPFPVSLCNRQTMEELWRSEEKYRLVFEEAANIIILLDKKTHVADCNIQIRNMLGYEPAKIINSPIEEIIHPDYREQTRDCLQETLAGDNSKTIECKMINMDGKPVNVRINSSRLKDKNGQTAGVICIVENITERKRLEEQLLMSQKMEAVGRLAGGIAHDFNNMLTAIIGYSEIALRAHNRDDVISSYINEIRNAGERASSLTQQLLAFSRKQVMQPKILLINNLIGNLEKMIGRLIGEDIELKLNLNPEAGRIKADPGQIEQVIMNLAINARDALLFGGKLIIETDNVDLNEEYGQGYFEFKKGAYVMIAVTDNGAGMDKETVSHIFEPFFTTKDKNKGTGLGLSTVYGIVKQSGGYIWVYSEKGKGTSFKVYFPRIEESVEPDIKREISAKSLNGTETLLVVEDEDMVREIITNTLNRYSYNVLVAKGPDEAFRLCDRNKGQINMLITDVIMKGMSGRDLAKKLNRRYPRMKILYISGYTDDIIIHHGILDPGINFMQKPFTPLTLAQKVRDVLSAS
jgi:two-component system cell cycle sensor histidine kinase/response regulator CckA